MEPAGPPGRTELKKKECPLLHEHLFIFPLPCEVGALSDETNHTRIRQGLTFSVPLMSEYS